MDESPTPVRWWSSPDIGFPASFLGDRRAMEASRLSLILTGTNEEQLEDLWVRVRRAATLLELSVLNGQWGTESLKMWSVVALIHEAVGVADSAKQGYQWILSSLAWQLAEAPSVALLLASQLISRDTFQRRDFVERMAIAFSLRNFHTLQVIAEQAIGLGMQLRAKVEESKDWSDALESGMLLSAGNVLCDLARYVQFQSDSIPTLSAMQDFLNLAASAGTSRRFRIGRLLSESLGMFLTASSRLLVDQLPTITHSSRKHLHAYLRKYPELWPSQQDAIKRGLLDPTQKYFIAALPTSSGKTLCGELVIIQELTDKPGATCFYVVPTRALVTEKSHELERKLSNFSVVGATGALQRDEIEASLLADAQVIVCTPEKLDLLVRHDDDSLSRASLFVIDETHMIADRDRGLGLEFAVVKLLFLKPDARILLLSAMLPNSEDFGRWLARGARVSSSNWRPTRQRQGEIVFRKLKPTGCRLEICLYDDSGELEGVRVSVRGYSRQPSSILEKVVWAVDALGGKGPALVFCMSKSRCERIVERIVRHLQEEQTPRRVSPAIERLQTKVRREIAEKFLLEKALAFGVAYHHADLPPRIRVDLEDLIAAGELSVIVSTTTLAEGVNLPISTVIFEDWMTHGDPRVGREPEPLDLSKFRNIAGRAGRAGKETEGLVLFLEPSRKLIELPDGQLVTPRTYFIRSEYPPVTSRFLEIVSSYRLPSDEDLDQAWEQGDKFWKPELRGALRQFALAVLHAIEALGLDDNTVINEVVGRSLLAVQSPDNKDTAKAWFGTWVRFYRRTDLKMEELRTVAMQVGLPLRSITQLYRRVSSAPELLDLFSTGGDEQLALSDEQIEAVARTVTSIEELDWQPRRAPHVQLLGSWLRGASIEQLAEVYTPHLSTQTRPLERTCSYTTQQLSNKGAWGMYGLARVLELILGEERLSPMAKRLSLLAYFGVCTVPAAILCLMGIERIDALRLGFAFLADGNTEPTVAALKSWTREVSTNRLTEILRGPDYRELDVQAFRILGVGYQQ